MLYNVYHHITFNKCEYLAFGSNNKAQLCLVLASKCGQETVLILKKSYIGPMLN